MRFGTIGGSIKIVQGRSVQCLIALAALSLAACGSSSSGNAGSGGSPSPTTAAAASTGPGATDAKNCAVPYGDPPAALSSPLSGSGTLGDILNLLNECGQIGGETLSWTDAQNEDRKACLITPANASSTSQLPLLVFLQGSLIPAPIQLILNDWASLSSTADLNGDPKRPGFILLIPIGRNTHHFYPFPDNQALGFDNWNRNLDRSSPTLNLDVAAIDQFIGQVEDRDIVDKNRVYATGWSNGAAMALLYALNTPSIAASAVYSSPDPYSDVQDPCEQTPFATTMTPLMDIHNACDIVGICQTGTQFHKDLAKMFPGLKQNSIIVDSDKNPVDACNATCAEQTITNPGTANHLLWPQKLNDDLFTWLREHPLSAKN